MAYVVFVRNVVKKKIKNGNKQKNGRNIKEITINYQKSKNIEGK